MNSEVKEAVEPVVLNVIEITELDATEVLAVNTTSEAEFSVILVLLNVKLTEGTGSESLIVNVVDTVELMVAFEADEILTIAVSIGSEIASRIPFKVIEPVKDPAGTLICGFN